VRIETWFFFFNSCSKGCVSWSYASHYIMWCVSKSWCATCDMHQSYDLRCLWHVPKLNSICHFSLCQGATLCSMWYTSRQYLVFYVVCIKAVPCDMHQSDALCSTCTWKWCLMFHVVSSKAMPYVPHGTPGCDDTCSMWYAWRRYQVCHVVHIKTIPSVPCCFHQGDALLSVWNTCCMWYASKQCPVEHMKVMPCAPCGMH